MLDVPNREEITRDQYNQKIAAPIRSFLNQQKLQDRIKVVVTMYGMPLKAGESEPTRSQVNQALQVKQKYYDSFGELENVLHELENLAGTSTSQPTTLPARDSIDQFNANLPKIAGKIESSYRAVISKIQKQSDSVERQMLLEQFLRIRLTMEGQGQIALASKNRPGTDPQIFAKAQRMRQEYQNLMGILPEKRDLDKTYFLAREFGGLILQLKTMCEDFGRLMQKESRSAVDSEHSLVLWDEYPLSG